MITRFLLFAATLASVLGAPAAIAEDAGALLWEVTSKSTTAYLLGTIHVGSPAMYPLPRVIEDAYSRARIIALEADPTDQSVLMMAMGSGMYEPPETLESNVPPALFDDVRGLFAANGLPLELARVMKPYMVAMTLAMTEVGRLGFDVSLGVDMHLAARAHQDGKSIVELESMAMQLAMLDAMSRETQVAMLDNTVQGLHSGTLKRDLEAMIAAWRAGDARRMDDAAMRDLKSMPPRAGRDLKEAMFDRRNSAMADKIVQLLAGSEVILVGVGAGHMTGPTGIVELLRARGFSVRRLPGEAR